MIDILRDVSECSIWSFIKYYFKNWFLKFGEINTDYLKSSGIGKAVMFLFKHSKETKDNKKKLERLISLFFELCAIFSYLLIYLFSFNYVQRRLV